MPNRSLKAVSLEALLSRLTETEGLSAAQQAITILAWHEVNQEKAEMTAGQLAAIMRKHALGNPHPTRLLHQIRALKMTMTASGGRLRILGRVLRDVAGWVGFSIEPGPDPVETKTATAKPKKQTVPAPVHPTGSPPKTTAKKKGAKGGRPLRLFIGSSVEGIDVGRAIEANLEFDCEHVLWDKNVFEPNTAPLESLLAEAEKADFAVVVLTPDDVISTRKQQYPVARDNCVFELGIFMGALGRKRAFYVHERDIKLGLPSDLVGLVTLRYKSRSDGNMKAALSVACDQIRKAMQKLGARG